MSDMETAGGGPIIATIAGREVKFAELTFNDRRALLKEHRKTERENLKALLAETGMTPDQQFIELRAFDKESVGAKVWAEFFFSHDGQIRILGASINKLNSGQGETLAGQLDWDDNQVLKTCAAICHVALVPLGGANANPPTAPTPGYGQ